MRKRIIGAGAVAGLVAVLAGGAGLAAPKAPRHLSYTADQATAGAQVYAVRCAMCHGRRLEGTLETPALTGKFVANWAGRPVGDLPAYLARAMPQFAPGSLTADEAVRLTAFILQANGYAAGARPLDAAERINLPLPPPIVAPRQ